MTSDPKWFEAERQNEQHQSDIDAIKMDLDDEYKPEVKEVTKLEVEDSVIAAVVEGQEEAKEEIEEPGGLMACNPDLLEHAKKFHADHDLPKEKKRKYPAHMLNALRKNDRYFNKTCSVCYTRVPLVKIKDGKGDVCDDCLEN